ncbi:MAG: hypothetical protein LBB22_04705 [Treponema sp.]|jgi:hypothetical protein|nr:hypothetical protein [Treponema sp.]
MKNENSRGGDRRNRRSGQVEQPRRQSARNNAVNDCEPAHGFKDRGSNKKSGREQEKGNKNFSSRPKWTSPKLRTEPIPTPICSYCKEPIKDLASAFSCKDNDEGAVHFDCALKRIAEMEPLEKGDSVTYIGGGRFGIVTFENPRVPGSFKIKKIIEWEQKEKRAPWRGHIADHFSLT